MDAEPAAQKPHLGDPPDVGPQRQEPLVAVGAVLAHDRQRCPSLAQQLGPFQVAPAAPALVPFRGAHRYSAGRAGDQSVEVLTQLSGHAVRYTGRL